MKKQIFPSLHGQRPSPLLTFGNTFRTGLAVSAAILPMLLFPVTGSAQLNQELEVTTIAPAFIKSPEFSIGVGPQKRAKSEDWLEVEAEFSFQPRGAQEIPFADDLTFTYYILLNNKDAKNPRGSLLVGQVSHNAVAIGKGMRSVMYLSPRTLQRFFGGKVPSTAAAAVQDVAVTITRQGQLVAAKNWKYAGSEQWWTTLQQTQGFVLNKNETPFAPLFWDYYEAIKAKPPGL